MTIPTRIATRPEYLQKLAGHVGRMLDDPELDHVGTVLSDLLPLLGETLALKDRVAELEQETWKLRYRCATLEAFREEVETERTRAAASFESGMEPLPEPTWRDEPRVMVQMGRVVHGEPA